MTTTVTIKTRGLGAVGSAGGQAFNMGPNEERRFDTNDTMSISFSQKTAEAADESAPEVKTDEPAAGEVKTDASRLPKVKEPTSPTGG